MLQNKQQIPVDSKGSTSGGLWIFLPGDVQLSKCFKFSLFRKIITFNEERSCLSNPTLRVRQQMVRSLVVCNPSVLYPRWCCPGQAVLWPQLLPHHRRDSSTQWEVSGSDGCRQMDPASLVPGGLPICGLLHPGQDLKTVLLNYQTLVRLVSAILSVCVSGGWVWVGQQLHPGCIALHHLPAEETGVGCHALEESSAGTLWTRGIIRLTHPLIKPLSYHHRLWIIKCFYFSGRLQWLDSHAEHQPEQRIWIQATPAVWWSEGRLFIVAPDPHYLFFVRHQPDNRLWNRQTL